MDERAQTAVEYILLVGTAIFLVVLVMLVVRGRVMGEAGKTIDSLSAQIGDAMRAVLK